MPMAVMLVKSPSCLVSTFQRFAQNFNSATLPPQVTIHVPVFEMPQADHPTILFKQSITVVVQTKPASPQLLEPHLDQSTAVSTEKKIKKVERWQAFKFLESKPGAWGYQLRFPSNIRVVMWSSGLGLWGDEDSLHQTLLFWNLWGPNPTGPNQNYWIPRHNSKL